MNACYRCASNSLHGLIIHGYHYQILILLSQLEKINPINQPAYSTTLNGVWELVLSLATSPELVGYEVFDAITVYAKIEIHFVSMILYGTIDCQELAWC